MYVCSVVTECMITAIKALENQLLLLHRFAVRLNTHHVCFSVTAALEGFCFIYLLHMCIHYIIF